MKILKWLFLAIPASSFLIISVANAQTTSGDTYTIKGSIVNMTPMPSKLYLMVNQKITDSAVVQNGNYVFTEPFKKPVSVQILGSTPPTGVMTVMDMASFYVNKGVINIMSDKVLNNFQLSGPGANVNIDYDAATVKSRRIIDSLKEVMKSPDFQTNKEKQASFRIAFSNIFKPVNDDLIAYLKIHPTTPAGPVMIEMIADLPFASTTTVDSLFQTMPADQQAIAKAAVDSAKAKKSADAALKAANSKKGVIGSIATDFTEKDTKGQDIKLSSLRGKYVLVDFWASWCAPCRAENPNVVNAYNKYKDKGFTVLGVSLDGSATKDAWIKAIATDKLSWTQVSDLNGWKNSAALVYGVSSIPQNFLIDPNGVIIGKNLRGEDLNAKLASIFK